MYSKKNMRKVPLACEHKTLKFGCMNVLCGGKWTFFSWSQITQGDFWLRCNHNNPHIGIKITRIMLAPLYVRSDRQHVKQWTQNISYLPRVKARQYFILENMHIQKRGRYDGTEEFIVHAWSALNRNSAFTGSSLVRLRMKFEQIEETPCWCARVCNCDIEIDQLHQEDEDISWSRGQSTKQAPALILYT